MSSGTGNAKDKAPHGSVERYVSITYFTAGACYRHAIATVRLTVATASSIDKDKEKPHTDVCGFMLALPIFPASRPATIVGANELNFCVRDGNRWTLAAINTNFFGWVFAHLLYIKAFAG